MDCLEGSIRRSTRPPPTPEINTGVFSYATHGAAAPPAAIANTVPDALSAIGAEINETPITPRRVMAAIAKAGKALSNEDPEL